MTEWGKEGAMTATLSPNGAVYKVALSVHHRKSGAPEMLLGHNMTRDVTRT